jgi:hypothetical protein
MAKNKRDATDAAELRSRMEEWSHIYCQAKNPKNPCVLFAHQK